ncbi:MAG: DUF58 domain-containing protein [Mesorhizobium sp.]|nr:DUF58 domain-containing protein [Mesorhizobium sp.]MBN9245565.1 DUF58 domain-containing protein [Mesorhizobium sp.]
MFGFQARHRSEPSGSPAVDLPLDHMIGLRAEAVRQRTLSGRGITPLPGLARTRLRGRGLDFDEVRPYAEGDDIRHIDWNVTARTGRPHTRLYREERERALTVALDLRASMFTGMLRLKAVAAGEMAAALLWQVAANRDRAAVLAFDETLTELSRPALRERGVLDALGVIDAVFAAARQRIGKAVEPRPLDAVLARINRLGRNAGQVVLVTDCAAPGPAFDAELAVAARRRQLAVLRIADPLELSGPPPGSYAFTLEGLPHRIRLDRGNGSAVQTELDRLNSALAQRFESAGVPYLVAATTLQAGDGWRLLAQAGLV